MTRNGGRGGGLKRVFFLVSPYFLGKIGGGVGLKRPSPLPSGFADPA